MIIKIRQSKTFKATCITLILSIFFEVVAPTQAWALTGGPAQPEFSSFTPVGTSDMVDLSSGDMSYNIPIMDVGGYPINLAYSSGVGMDDEASWVGLGWNLSAGQINRNVRGIPDDFKGDKIQYENYLKPNVTVGASFKFSPHLIGVSVLPSETPDTTLGANVSLGVSLMYNNYSGFSVKPSVGITLDLGKAASVGFNVESGADGLSLSPSLSLHNRSKTEDGRDRKTGASVGIGFNSRQGLTTLTMNASRITDDCAYKFNDKNKKTNGGPSLGSYVSYAANTYTPAKRVGMTTKSFTMNASVGFELFGGEGNGQITAYGTVMEVLPTDTSKELSAYGYSNPDLGNKFSVLDFNREKDGNFSVNSTNLAVTNYTYDVYSVQGQGVSGMYRPYRNQVGYVYDAEVNDGSTSGSLGLEFGTGNAVHFGLDFEVSTIDSKSGLWENDNSILTHFKDNSGYNPRYEKVHYKNVGDLSVDRDFGMFSGVGEYNAIRVQFIGNKFNRRAVNELKKKYSWSGSESILAVGGPIKRTKRQLRNQAIQNITVAQLNDGIGNGPVARGQAIYSGAKGHHIGEVDIVRNDGARYVYGLPAYNTLKREATFAVDGTPDCQNGLVGYLPGQVNNPTTLPNDRYFNRITTPGYVHTHLLTSILSTDYQDLSGDGPSEDDLGSYTKFTYNKKNDSYKWRVPFLKNKANYNEGLKTDPNDDQGNYVYGSKELYYIKTIETKTHIAIFTISERHDAYGVNDESGANENSVTNSVSWKLDKIELYSIGEYYLSNGSINPDRTPIKTAFFEYDYSLCPGVPNNDLTGTNNQGGKLTLKKVYFEYRNSKMGKYTPYTFNYSDFNPSYNMKGYDTWGNYLPNNGNCLINSSLNAPEFPYTSQDPTLQNNYASAWLLDEINLPSGGSISVTYESDDYSYIQDKHVNRMFIVKGAGNDNSVSSSDVTGSVKSLFKVAPQDNHTNFLYIQVDDNEIAGLSPSLIYQKYLSNLENKLIYFRFLLNMTMQGGESESNIGSEKYDYVTGYAQFDSQLTSSLSIQNVGGQNILTLPVKMVDKEGGIAGSQQVNPIAKAGWNFGRKYLSSHVYSNQPNGDSEDLAAIVPEMLASITSLMEIFSGPNGALENKNVCRKFVTTKSWVRLVEPDKVKLGGGSRVKQIKITDNWADMNSVGETMSYGQEYNYTLVESEISSGVATYEPIGNKENPFVQPVFSSTAHILAPDEENYVEKPFGESFFPSPQVTYSRVTVSNVQFGLAPTNVPNAKLKKMHKTGKVVTEFYTSKDYPTIVDQTKLEAKEDKSNALANILSLKTRKHFIASQGYVIHLNDMNGKQKAQWVYAEGQSAPISGVKYIYDDYSTPIDQSAVSTSLMNKGKLNNLVKVINPNGSIEMKTIGVEVDVVNDFRENKTITEIPGINANLATFFIGVIPGLVPIPLPDYTKTEDQFRSVTTTKVINTFGILKETIAYDAGAKVHTRNLAWDAQTGEVLITETVDEFDDKYYTLNYPAHWYYDGMAQASKNLGLEGSLNASSGSYSMQNTGGLGSSSFLINGDELFVQLGTNNFIKGWVVNLQGNQFSLIDETGVDINAPNNAKFVVFRSGHRNLQSAGIMNVTLKHNPLLSDVGTSLTSISPTYLNTVLGGNHWKVINAGAVDYSDRWKVGCECGVNALEGVYNPYFINERGVWRTKSSRTYLTGRDYQNEVTPRMDGYMSSFSPMYKTTAGGHWTKDFTNWTFVAEVSKYSRYGFELENKDALKRYSAAQYGYNNTFPMAVGANTEYRQIGYDGFEDYDFGGCPTEAHFNFKDVIAPESVVNEEAHTGKNSLKVGGSSNLVLTKILSCSTAQP